MPRRHDALIPFSHDHHHALHELRLLREAASDEDDDARRAAAARFVEFFRNHSVAHFREEEEELLPMVVDHDEFPTAAVSRMMLEHVEIHALVKRLEEGAEPGTMRRLAELLRAHIRFEEDELFPEIERLVGERLNDLALAPRPRRSGS